MKPPPYTGAIRGHEHVRSMFASISPRYDLLNHTLSFGVDFYWRAATIRQMAPRIPGPLLDVCCGTGDLAVAMARRYPDRRVIGVDFCAPMLDLARRKLAWHGLGKRVDLVEGDARSLPFVDDLFSGAAVAFGIRNVADLSQGVAEMARVVRPGGTVAILEFSRPPGLVSGRAYRFYMRHILPRIGRLVAGNGTDAYQYLSDSVKAFVEPEALVEHMRVSGLTGVRSRRLTFGIATLYTGQKAAPFEGPGRE